jgi:hypothetical protein
MALWMAARPTTALPSDPDNAALLYYQACVIPPEPENPGAFDLVVRGADPNDTSRKYLNRREWRDTLELLQAATEMPRCDWGLVYSRGLSLPLQTMSSLSRLGRLLKVYACTQAMDGRQEEAIETCVRMRRMAQHIGDDTYLTYATSWQVEREALLATQYVLGCMLPGEQMLARFKKQLTTVPATPWRPERALSSFRDIEFQYRLTHDKHLANWGVKSVRLSEDEIADKQTQTPTDEQLLGAARQSYDQFLNAVLETLASDLGCEQKRAELERQENLWTERAREGDPILLLWDPVTNVHGYFHLHMDNLVLTNAMMTAIEVYLVKARTGQLPDVLPSNAPKDPYNGKDFTYEKSEKGFVIRSSPSPFLASRKTRQFEFRCGENSGTP